MLVFPVSFTSLSILGMRCYRQKKFLETLPLLFTQFNASLMWGCLAAYEIGLFHFNITRTQIMKGSMGSLREIEIKFFLQWMIYIAPMNLFLYTWRFLRELEQSVSNKVLKHICRGFEILTIVVLPPAFYAIITGMLYAGGEEEYYGAKLEIKKATHAGKISSKFGLVLVFLNPIVTVTACLILGLVVFLVFKLSRQVRVGKNAVAAKR